LLTGRYDCVDRIVLNAYNVLCYNAGGFRCWWRRLTGSDDDLDDAHLMRMAGRFSRRVRGFAEAHQIRVVDCGRDERKHQVAEEYLATHPEAQGLFLVLVARAVAPVWEVTRASGGVLRDLRSKKAFVHHYSFHVLDPEWGHLTIKMSGHPPFGAQISLNGHEYVRLQAARAGVAYDLAGNAFTRVPESDALAAVADTLSEERMIGRLTALCDRWISSTCLCFALHSADQERTGFHYDYAVYQLEYSRNLLFRNGHQMEQVFQGLIDRTRRRLGVPELGTIFGQKHRPHQDRKDKASQIAVRVETPAYDLTLFKLHFGKLTLKAYTKGEQVLRFEAIVHNATALGCGRVLSRFPRLVAHLHAMVDRFLETVWCLDHAFVADATLEDLPTPAQLGKTRVGGIDLHKPRMRAVLAAALALAVAPDGFRVGDLARHVQRAAACASERYGTRQAAYDLKKLRAKGFIQPVPGSRRYRVTDDGVRIIAALVVLRDQVIKPLLAGSTARKVGRKPKGYTAVDAHYDSLRKEMLALFADLGLAAA
jgi:hypothetical protein